MRQVHYDASEHIQASDQHPFERPAFSLKNRAARALWGVLSLLLFRLSPRPLHRWRALLLRCFGAKLGQGVHIYGGAKIWAPWNLICGDYVAIGDGAEIYNPAPMHLHSFVIVSQNAYVCGATHDYNKADFPLLAYAMTLEKHAWICARACVGPGVRVGEGAVLGLGSVATRDLEPWTVYAGSPAIAIRPRIRSTLENFGERADVPPSTQEGEA